MPLGIVVGLAAEAGIVRRLGVPVGIGGGTPAGARKAAEALLTGGASTLLSFGLAGGLDPALAAGEIVIPSAVLSTDRRFDTDPRLSSALGGPTPHLLLAADRPIAEPGDKSILYARSGCAAADLESGSVAEAAAARGVPFAVLRAICDPAGRPLPAAALVALDAKGIIGLSRIVASLVQRPAQIPLLLALARDAAIARRALVQHVRQLSLARHPGYSPGTDTQTGSRS